VVDRSNWLKLNNKITTYDADQLKFKDLRQEVYEINRFIEIYTLNTDLLFSILNDKNKSSDTLSDLSLNVYRYYKANKDNERL